MKANLCPGSPSSSGAHWFDQERFPHRCIHCGLTETDYVESALSGGCVLPKTPPCEPPPAGAIGKEDPMRVAIAAAYGNAPSASDFGRCAGCGAPFTAAVGLPGNLCVRCAKKLEAITTEARRRLDEIDWQEWAANFRGRKPGVNDDLAAFGEIVAGPRGQSGDDPDSDLRGPAATLCPHCKIPFWGAICPHCPQIELRAQIAATHHICDELTARFAGSTPRPLPERVAAIRRMVNDAAPDDGRDLEDEPDTDRPVFVGILCFFIGAMFGVFTAWGFLVLFR